ncbi:hypothetical protein T492DRAFT_1074680 [Pavlovales sp. CCMP2436]|nr:hypothetical protein T492DRAFT_1074680 [Pavlovales sp. CCMP2436]
MVQLQLRLARPARCGFSTAPQTEALALLAHLEAALRQDGLPELSAEASRLPDRALGTLEWLVKLPYAREARARNWRPAERALLLVDARVPAVGNTPSPLFEAELLARVAAVLAAAPACKLTLALVGKARAGLLPLLVRLEALDAARVRTRVLPPGAGASDALLAPFVALARHHSVSLVDAIKKAVGPFQPQSFLNGLNKVDLLLDKVKPKDEHEAWLGVLCSLVPKTTAQAVVAAYSTFALLATAWTDAGPGAAPLLLERLARNTTTRVRIGPSDSSAIHRFFTADLHPSALADGSSTNRHTTVPLAVARSL